MFEMDSPMVHAIRDVPFDVFGHLSFKNPRPAGREVHALMMRIIRKSGRLSHTHLERILFVARGEYGEATHRFHMHILLGNLGLLSHTTGYLMTMKDAWSAARFNVGSFAGVMGDISQWWPYDPSLDGVGYVMKGLERYEFAGEARSYELSKFGLTDEVTVSDSMLRFASRRIGTLPLSIETLKHGETVGSGEEQFADQHLELSSKVR
jgi:hypothetical protein